MKTFLFVCIFSVLLVRWLLLLWLETYHISDYWFYKKQREFQNRNFLCSLMIFLAIPVMHTLHYRQNSVQVLLGVIIAQPRS